MNRNWLQLFFILVLTTGALYYLFQMLDNSSETSSDDITEIEEVKLEEEEAIAFEEVELSPEMKAARKDLRELPLEAGSVGDKLLNFLLSEKRSYMRELYEFKNNSYTEEEEPGQDLANELDHLSQILLAYPRVKIEVVSHTSGEGSWQEQQDRSGKRAENIKAYLNKKGVEPLRIEVSGYGANYPIADDDSERARKMNNRTELLIRGL